MNDKSEFRIKVLGSKLSLWCFTNVINQIPKTYSAYRTIIMNTLNSLNENILRANLDNGPAKSRYQREVLVSLAMLDDYLGCLKNLNIIDPKLFMKTVKQINELEKMIYGWMNNNEKAKQPILS